ncbi:MAG: DUF2256 domain-containing protein [Caenispirillum bisanense]|nr:DUF2256 domain-containing protein [Caenispirillum bisanense]MCA1972667.1 DUF2256 domain-containing protein [Caenispirillum sp.]
MAHAKPHLPVKTCPACGRPFAWRRKCALVWAEVVWCSERCRRDRKRVGAAAGGPAVSPAVAAAAASPRRT